MKLGEGFICASVDIIFNSKHFPTLISLIIYMHLNRLTPWQLLQKHLLNDMIVFLCMSIYKYFTLGRYLSLWPLWAHGFMCLSWRQGCVQGGFGVCHRRNTEKSSYEKVTVVAKEVLTTKVSSANQAVVWRGDDPKFFLSHPSTTHWGPGLVKPQIWVPGKGRVVSSSPRPTGLWKERDGMILKVRGFPDSSLRNLAQRGNHKP